MNIQATLAKCRDELKRQKEMEEWTTQPPWHRLGEQGEAAIQCITGKIPVSRAKLDQEQFVADGEESVVVIMGYAHGFRSENLKVICLTRNLNPARLKVAEDKLEYAQERLDELNADMAALCELSAHRPYCQEDIPAKDFNEMYDGEEQLQDAIALLGVEVVE